MATPRKRFASVETSLLREEWPDELRLTLVLLMLHMTDRWASDKLRAEQACRCRLSPGDLMNVTSSSSFEVARERIRALPGLVSLKVIERGTATEIYWPKLAETQGWRERDNKRAAASARISSVHTARSRGNAEPEHCPSIARSHTHTHTQRSEEEAEAEKNTLRVSRTRRATAPEQALLPVVTTDRESGVVVPIGGERTRTDPTAWARMFAKEAEVDLVVDFVHEVLPEIEGRADAEFPHVSDPSDRAWNGAVRSWLWRYWRARGRIGRDRGDEKREARARRLVENARAALRLTEERERRSRATA